MCAVPFGTLIDKFEFCFSTPLICTLRIISSGRFKENKIPLKMRQTLLGSVSFSVEFYQGLKDSFFVSKITVTLISRSIVT